MIRPSFIALSVAVILVVASAIVEAVLPPCPAPTGAECISFYKGDSYSECNCPSDGSCYPDGASLSITYGYISSPCKVYVDADWSCAANGQKAWLEYDDAYIACLVRQSASNWTYNNYCYQESGNGVCRDFTIALWMDYNICGSCWGPCVLVAGSAYCD